MIAFLIVAVLMVAGALLAVLPSLLVRREAEVSGRAAANITLLRRALEDSDAELRSGAIDRAQWEQNRSELERRVIEESQTSDGAKSATTIAAKSPRVALLIGILLPVLAIPLYVLLGEPRAITGRMAGNEESMSHAVQADQIRGMAERLAERLKAAPDDVEGWLMLSRTYVFLERLTEAVQALETALKLRPDDASLLADYADMYAATKGGGSLMGEPEKLVKRALSLDPNQPKALALAGTIAFQKKDFATAAKHWERAVSVLPPDSPFGKQIAAGLAEAREALTRKGGTPMASTAAKAASTKTAPSIGTTTTQAKSSAAGGTVSGTVILAPELAKRTSPGDTVFVFARLPEGGAPLAVIRAKVSELPLKFTMDDAMAMGPDSKLSNAPRVVVTARITKSGNVVAQSGDLEGVSSPVIPGTAPITLRIDKERR